jgi:hypothetical protein
MHIFKLLFFWPPVLSQYQLVTYYDNMGCEGKEMMYEVYQASCIESSCINWGAASYSIKCTSSYPSKNIKSLLNYGIIRNHDGNCTAAIYYANSFILNVCIPYGNQGKIFTCSNGFLLERDYSTNTCTDEHFKHSTSIAANECWGSTEAMCMINQVDYSGTSNTFAESSIFEILLYLVVMFLIIE